MTQPQKTRILPREEDYRDYQERDTRDGWPYSDESGLSSPDPENREYGATPANFDAEPKSGVIGDTAGSTGLEEDTAQTAGPLSSDRIDSDELEAEITERLIQTEGVDADRIEVHVDQGIVTLEGSAETAAIARQIEVLALSMPGVLEVHNNLKTIGVDSHISPDT